MVDKTGFLIPYVPTQQTGEIIRGFDKRLFQSHHCRVFYHESNLFYLEPCDDGLEIVEELDAFIRTYIGSLWGVLLVDGHAPTPLTFGYDPKHHNYISDVVTPLTNYIYDYQRNAPIFPKPHGACDVLQKANESTVDEWQSPETFVTQQLYEALSDRSVSADDRELAKVFVELYNQRDRFCEMVNRLEWQHFGPSARLAYTRLVVARSEGLQLTIVRHGSVIEDGKTVLLLMPVSQYDEGFTIPPSVIALCARIVEPARWVARNISVCKFNRENQQLEIVS